MLDSRTGVPACTLLWNGTAVIGRAWKFRLYDVFWRVYFNLDQGATIRHPGGIFAIPAGIPVAIPPYGEFHASCIRQVRHAWLHFDAPIPMAEEVRALVPRPMALRPREEWDRLFAALPLSRSAPAHLLMLCQSLICSAIVEACSGGEPDRGWQAVPAMAQARHRIEPALRRINADIARPLNGQALATLCDMTRSHFVRSFRLATGQSPARYLAERRIHSVASVLVGTDLSIERLASDFGFADRYHFTRVFTRVMRVSPAAYRRASRG
jgi:AraC-like DNA-binding protein